MGWFGPTLREKVLSGDLSIAVTGAGSWLAQALLADLAAEGLLPAGPRLRLFATSARSITVAERDLRVEALMGAPPLQGGPWLLLHYAFLGKEKSEDRVVGDFIAENDAILKEVLRIAEPASSLRMVFSSSGAAYGPDRQLAASPDGNPYGWCKVQHERRLNDWCAERGAGLVVPRIFSLGGPWINKIDSYALSSMILAAKRTGVIRIMAQRPVFRSFVHVSELNGLLCEMSLSGEAGREPAFDTAGLETLEMADLADSIARTCLPAEVRVERTGLLTGDADYYVGNGIVYRTKLALIGRRIASIADILHDTTRFLRPVWDT